MYKLLIVDDNQTHIQCILDYVDWASFGFDEIKTASNGAEGYECFLAFHPDLIITDVVMPVSDGLEMTRRIREISQTVYIVFMSCYEEFEYAKSAIHHDVISYLLKPIQPDILQDLVKTIVGKIEKQKKAIENETLVSSVLPAIKESLLYRLLYSDELHDEFIDSVLNQLNYANYHSFIIIKLLLPQNEEYAYIHQLQKQTEASFSDSFSVDTLIENKENLIIMLCAQNDCDTSVADDLTAKLQMQSALFQKQCGKVFFAGVSEISRDLHDAPKLLFQANSALSAAWPHSETDVQNDNTILFYEKMPMRSYKCDLTHLRCELTDVLSKRDSDFTERFLQQYYPDPSAGNHAVQAFCFSVITALQIILQDYNSSFDDLFGTTDILWNKLNHFESILNSRQWIKNILFGCCEFVGKMDKNKHRTIISRIIEYIRTNYRTITSVEQIAAELYISAGYAKNMFKKHTGQTIFDYLIETRINEAKKLLANPDVKVYEVSELVGYSNKTHFAETFKRKTGLNPKEYQKKMLGHVSEK